MKFWQKTTKRRLSQNSFPLPLQRNRLKCFQSTKLLQEATSLPEDIGSENV